MKGRLPGTQPFSRVWREGWDLLALNFPEQLSSKHPAVLVMGELLGGSAWTGPSPITPCPLGPGPGMMAQQPGQDTPKNGECP